MTRRPLVALLMISLVSGGCLTLLGGEEKAGAAAHRQVVSEMGLVDDPALVSYVEKIGKRLVTNASRENVNWRFYVVDMPEPNAFALPGGYVYVSRGLLALVNQEDELAGVIGHEIGHVTAGHGNKRVTLSAPFTIVTGITGWATGIVSPTLGNAVSGAGNTLAEGLVIAPFSRGQEREADRIGATLAAQSGWEPGALGRFLTTLGRFQKLVTGKEARASWLDSHPPSPERAAASKEFARGLDRATPNPIARDQADLFGRLDGLALGPDPRAGLVVGGRFVQPSLGFSLRFPPGWSVVNTPTAVGSQEPGGKAALLLQIAVAGRSLDQAIAEVQKEDASVQFERFEVNGNPAARTQVSQRGHTIDLTWIGYGGDVYQLAGIAPSKQHPSFKEAFRQAVMSFRKAGSDEIDKIRARRLRIATADSGESLKTLLERVGSAWKPATAVVANGLADGAKPTAGQLVKYAREEPYRP